MKNFARQKINPAQLPAHLLAKWPAAVLAEGFVPFPKKLLRCLKALFDERNSVGELAVILAVADFNRERLSRLPSLEFLAFVAGLEEEEVKAVLDRLQAKGFIQVSGDFTELDIRMNGLFKVIEQETDDHPPPS